MAQDLESASLIAAAILVAAKIPSDMRELPDEKMGDDKKRAMKECQEAYMEMCPDITVEIAEKIFLLAKKRFSS